MIDNVATTDNTSCAAPNGTATATASVPPPGTNPLSGFDYYWYDGTQGAGVDTTAADFLPNKTDFQGGLDSLNFTVFAVDKDTRCISDPFAFKINPSITPLAINMAITDQTACAPGVFTGAVSATPDAGAAGAGDEPAGGYTFRWFQGQFAPNSHPADPPDLTEDPSSTPTVSNVVDLSKGFYTVFVINTDNGCEDQQEAFVDSVAIAPTVAGMEIQPRQSCAVLDGIAEAAAAPGAGGTNPIAGYDYYWYIGTLGNGVDTTAADFMTNQDAVTASQLANLDSLDFTVFSVDKDTRCISAPGTFTITANLDFPAIVTTLVAEQTHCNPSADPNGIINATASTTGGEPSGYTFTWFDGPNTLPGNQLVTGAGIAGNPGLDATDLDKGVYRVLVVNDDTGCDDTGDVTVTENITLPVLDPLVTADQTNCAMPDGTASASVSGGTAGFDFYWFDGKTFVNEADTSGADFKGTPYTNLLAGDYTAVAVDQNTRCMSDSLSAPVLFNPPPLDAVFTNILPLPTTCDAEGAFQVDVNLNNGGAGYDFDWYREVSTAPGNFIASDSDPMT